MGSNPESRSRRHLRRTIYGSGALAALGVGMATVGVVNAESSPIPAYASPFSVENNSPKVSVALNIEPPKPTTSVTIFEKPKSPTTTLVEPKPKSMPATTSTTRRPNPTSSIQTPSSTKYDQTYKAAGERFGVPPQILYGLHKTESGLAEDGPTMNNQGSGARGPMQFMPETWKGFGVDGDNDGDRDIDNVVDSVFGAANYISKLPGSIEAKLKAYGANVADTMAAARSKGYS